MKLNNPLKVNFTSAIKTVTKAEAEDKLYITGYANTVAKDRAGDVIPKSAWEDPEALANYKKNPIILAYHDHSKPIGKMVDFNITDLGLEIRAEISKGAGDVYNLIKDGILSTFSVGFSIKDAKYIPDDDTYYINKLELFEVSVVSIPCNQDSIFSVSKSMDTSDFEKLKSQLTPKTEGANIKGNDTMSFDFEKFQAEMATLKADMTKEAAEAAANAVLAAEKAKQEAAEKAAAEKAAAEKAAKEAKTLAEQAAKDLVKQLEADMAKGQEVFAKSVKEQQETIVALKEEIAQLNAAREKGFRMNAATAGVRGLSDAEQRKEIGEVVLLGLVTKQNMFDTKLGQRAKAVNTSSSIQVSSDAYETVFETDLIRDIQAELVIAPLFDEIAMSSANLTIPVDPNRKNASWVTAAQYGTDNSSGSELTAALTEITLKTYKLAAKSYVTDETEEDAIIPLLPIIRRHLVEAHANEIDRAFLLGTGTNQPLGLVPAAAAAESGAAADVASGTVVTTATANGATPVTAKMILQARKKLKLYGLNVRDIALVVSTEAYYGLLEDDAWADVNQVGNDSVKLSGQVGSIYGMPVIVSDHFPAPALSAAYAVMVHRSNFVVPRQRGATIKTDFDVEKDRRVIVATQRLNLESLIRDAAGHAKGVVACLYAAV